MSENLTGIPNSCCISGFIHSGTPNGEIIKINNLNCYYSAPPSSNDEKYPTIIYLTDAFGYTFINSQLLADTYAKNGFHVYIPDLHQGDSADPSLLDVAERPNTSFFSPIYKSFVFLTYLPGLINWLGRHGQSVTLPLSKPVYDEIIALSQKNGNGKVGAVGFCWGGRYAILAGGGENPVVDAFVAAHPSRVVIPNDLEAINRPGLFILAESDFEFSQSKANKAKEILKERAEYITYPGTQHGFAVRGGPDTEKSRENAAQKTVEFFKKHLY
mmetsp:Transcript_6863/g.6165  ORF Transcript_6863/g.6165 Transcript_6863/m.6165 type:complete len:272 (+) Transcript_6863:3-818(+)